MQILQARGWNPQGGSGKYDEGEYGDTGCKGNTVRTVSIFFFHRSKRSLQVFYDEI
jgi:hypothetical protein